MRFQCSSVHMTSRKNWKRNWGFNSRYICMIKNDSGDML